MHFITPDTWGDAALDGVRLTFKNRHTPDFFPGTMRKLADAPGEYVIESDVRVQGIAPGQFTAIYDPDSRICYGSGIISGASKI